jgi:hypothetical protein
MTKFWQLMETIALKSSEWDILISSDISASHAQVASLNQWCQWWEGGVIWLISFYLKFEQFYHFVIFTGTYTTCIIKIFNIIFIAVV